MFVVPSGVVDATVVTIGAAASGRLRAVTVRRTGAQRERNRVEGSGCGRPGVKAGVTGRGSNAGEKRERSAGGSGFSEEREPASRVVISAAINPTPTRPTSQATSRKRLTR